MTTQLGTSALEALERAGLKVHAQAGDHDHIGKHHRVSGRIDISVAEPHGRTVALTVAGGTAMRQLPLTDFQAEGMVDELQQNGLFHPSAHVAKMLQHLLVHAANVAEELDLRTLILDPIAVAEGGYCIDAAALTYRHSPPPHGIEHRFRQGRDNVLKSPRYHERP